MYPLIYHYLSILPYPSNHYAIINLLTYHYLIIIIIIIPMIPIKKYYPKSQMVNPKLGPKPHLIISLWSTYFNYSPIFPTGATRGDSTSPLATNLWCFHLFSGKSMRSYFIAMVYDVAMKYQWGFLQMLQSFPQTGLRWWTNWKEFPMKLLKERLRPLRSCLMAQPELHTCVGMHKCTSS